jgi:hypothetical protein
MRQIPHVLEVFRPYADTGGHSASKEPDLRHTTRPEVLWRKYDVQQIDAVCAALGLTRSQFIRTCTNNMVQAIQKQIGQPPYDTPIDPQTAGSD